MNCGARNSFYSLLAVLCYAHSKPRILQQPFQYDRIFSLVFHNQDTVFRPSIGKHLETFQI